MFHQTFLQVNEDIWSYLTLFSACVNILTVDGAMYSNGLFTNKLSHYLEVSEEDVQRAATLEVICSAVFSLVATLLLMHVGPKLVAVAGSSIAAIGWLSAAKMVTNTSQLILCQSALVGVGFGLMYVPSIVAVGAKFSTNRSWALGCATCGSAAGQIVISLLIGVLLDDFALTWQNIYNGLAIACFFASFVAFLFIPWSVKRDSGEGAAPDEPNSEEGPIAAGEGQREISNLGKIGIFFLHLLGDAFAVMAIYMPYASIPLVSSKMAKNLITWVGGGSLCGRYFAGSLCNKAWLRIVHKMLLILAALAIAAVIPSLHAKLLDLPIAPQVLCFLLGGATGIWISSTSPVLIDLLGVDNLGLAFGVLTLGRGGAALISELVVSKAEQDSGDLMPLYISTCLFSTAVVFLSLAAFLVRKL